MSSNYFSFWYGHYFIYSAFLSLSCHRSFVLEKRCIIIFIISFSISMAGGRLFWLLLASTKFYQQQKRNIRLFVWQWYISIRFILSSNCFKVSKSYNFKKQFIYDKIASTYEIIGISACYCNFDPMQLIWHKIKSNIGVHNNIPTLNSSVTKLTKTKSKI